METKIKNIKFHKCEFNGTEVMKTNFNNIDFSNSEISRAIFDLQSLKGIIINSYQCMSFVGMLGIHIKDEM